MSIPTPYSQPTGHLAWTRIDMLVALYDSAIDHLDNTTKATAEGLTGQAAVHRTRAAALVMAIRTGIDATYDDVASRVDQLCEYAQYCIVEGDADKLASATNVLRELRDGFSGIRDEAARLERRGEIPSLPTDATVEVDC